MRLYGFVVVCSPLFDAAYVACCCLSLLVVVACGVVCLFVPLRVVCCRC